MFCAITDAKVVERIDAARRNVLYAAPALAGVVADALLRAAQRLGHDGVAVFVDVDEDAYRLGYGDTQGARRLVDLAHKARVRKQSGLRIGLLAADGELWVWTPAPLSVEAERKDNEPNGIALPLPSSGATDPLALLRPTEGMTGGAIPPSTAAIQPKEVEQVVTQLVRSPPAPFDLSRVTRVFSCKYQFVEIELKGAEWTNKKLQLSSFLLNSDVPEELGDLLQTTIQPFKSLEDEAFAVPMLVQGGLVYRADRSLVTVPMTQKDLRQTFDSIRERYVRRVGRFGWILEQEHRAAFELEIKAFEKILKSWVLAFRERATRDEKQLVQQVVNVIMQRVKHSDRAEEFPESRVEQLVSSGLQRQRVTEPAVELIYKDIAPDSVADPAFLTALRSALTKEEQRDWYEFFDAAPEDPTRRDARLS